MVFQPLDAAFPVAVFFVPVFFEGFAGGLDFEMPRLCFDLAAIFDFFAAALLADLPRRLGASLQMKTTPLRAAQSQGQLPCRSRADTTGGGARKVPQGKAVRDMAEVQPLDVEDRFQRGRMRRIGSHEGAEGGAGGLLQAGILRHGAGQPGMKREGVHLLVERPPSRLCLQTGCELRSIFP